MEEFTNNNVRAAKKNMYCTDNTKAKSNTSESNNRAKKLKKLSTIDYDKDSVDILIFYVSK